MVSTVALPEGQGARFECRVSAVARAQTTTDRNVIRRICAIERAALGLIAEKGFVLWKPDDGHAAGLRRAAEVVAEGNGGVLHLALAGFALQLLVVLIEHPHPGRAGGMAERLEAPVGIYRQLAIQRKGAGGDVLLGGALLTQAEIFVGEQLSEGEAVVDLCDVDLL